MKKALYFLIALLAYLSPAKAQSTDTTLIVYMAEDTVLAGVFPYGGAYLVIPVFTDTNINNIVNNYSFTMFEWLNTYSIYPDMQHYYKIKCNNHMHLAEELTTNFPDLFLEYWFDFPAVTLNTAHIASSPLQAHVFPNPATTTLNFEFPPEENIDISITDVTGMLIAQQSFKNTAGAVFDVRPYISGMYFYQVKTIHHTYAGKVLIKH